MKTVQCPPLSVGAGGPTKYGDVIDWWVWMDGWGGTDSIRLKRKNKNVIIYCVCKYVENARVSKDTLLRMIF